MHQGGGRSGGYGFNRGCYGGDGRCGPPRYNSWKRKESQEEKEPTKSAEEVATKESTEQSADPAKDKWEGKAQSGDKSAWVAGSSAATATSQPKDGGLLKSDSMDEDDGYYDYEADDHRPVSCGMVRAWQAKNASNSETANWVLTHTKHCPKCRRPIEKNQECNHMTCGAPCYHQFCWLCF